MRRCLPVKKGWQAEQISSLRSSFLEDRVVHVAPQAQWTFRTSVLGVNSWLHLVLISLRRPESGRRAHLMSRPENPSQHPILQDGQQVRQGEVPVRLRTGRSSNERSRH